MAWNVEFFSFILVASGALLYGYECGDDERSILSFLFSLMFWLATMWQWFVDQGNTDVLAIGWAYTFPIMLCVYEVLMRVTGLLDTGTKVSRVE